MAFSVSTERLTGNSSVHPSSPVWPAATIKSTSQPSLQLRGSVDERGILLLTICDTDADIVRAIESGANGYPLKDTSRDELVRAITAVGRGGSWLTPSVAARLFCKLDVNDHTAAVTVALERGLISI